MLNGEIRTAPSTFKALNSSSVPYRVFGMINMCDAEKVIEVDRRVLIYYKYDFDTVNCVKVLRNKHRTRLNIRFLQVRDVNKLSLSSYLHNFTCDAVVQPCTKVTQNKFGLVY